LNGRVVVVSIGVVLLEEVEGLIIPFLAISQRGDPGMKKMNTNWMTEGNAWVRVGILQDQSLGILLLPKVSQVQTEMQASICSQGNDENGFVILMAPTFQKQL
jgi:hypothetical protein